MRGYRTIIAIDPDILKDNQAVYFEFTKSDNSVNWVLNGKEIGKANGIQFWNPKLGKYKLLLKNQKIPIRLSLFQYSAL